MEEYYGNVGNYSLFLLNRRKRKSKKYNYTLLLLAGIGIGIMMVGCQTDYATEWHGEDGTGGFVGRTRPTLPEDVIFAPTRKEMLNDLGYGSEYYPAVPENPAEYDAMVQAAKAFIPGIVDTSQMACYQAASASLSGSKAAKITIPDTGNLTKDFKDLTNRYVDSAKSQARVWLSNNMTRESTLSDTTNAVFFFTLNAPLNEFNESTKISEQHMALIAYYNNNEKSRSILIQVDGSPAGSGVFYTRLNENSFYKLAETMKTLEWVGVALH